jgi:hypothetical protein
VAASPAQAQPLHEIRTIGQAYSDELGSAGCEARKGIGQNRPALGHGVVLASETATVMKKSACRAAADQTPLRGCTKAGFAFKGFDHVVDKASMTRARSEGPAPLTFSPKGSRVRTG